MANASSHDDTSLRSASSYDENDASTAQFVNTLENACRIFGIAELGTPLTDLCVSVINATIAELRTPSKQLSVEDLVDIIKDTFRPLMVIHSPNPDMASFPANSVSVKLPMSTSLARLLLTRCNILQSCNHFTVYLNPAENVWVVVASSHGQPAAQNLDVFM